MARKRRQPDPAEPPKGHPLLRLLTADAVLRAGSFALRQAVGKGLVKGRAAAAVPDQPPSTGTRVLTAAASALATRSVPGALLVGTGMVVHTLYKRGKARRAQAAGRAADVGGTAPPT